MEKQMRRMRATSFPPIERAKCMLSHCWRRGRGQSWFKAAGQKCLAVKPFALFLVSSLLGWTREHCYLPPPLALRLRLTKKKKNES